MRWGRLDCSALGRPRFGGSGGHCCRRAVFTGVVFGQRRIAVFAFDRHALACDALIEYLVRDGQLTRADMAFECVCHPRFRFLVLKYGQGLDKLTPWLVWPWEASNSMDFAGTPMSLSWGSGIDIAKKRRRFNGTLQSFDLVLELQKHGSG